MTASATVLSTFKRWAWLALPAILLVLLGSLYGRVLAGLVRNWQLDDTYSHGFVVPLFSVFLLWRDRARLAACPRAAWPAGLLLAWLGIALRVLGEFAAENFLTRISLLFVLAGLALGLHGRARFRLMAFPIAYLVFMIPIPAVIFNSLAFPLQRMAARWAARLLHMLDIPVLLEGTVLHLSNVTLGVTEECSGLRSLMALVAAAAAWSYLKLQGLGPRIGLVLAAVPVAIAANIGRVAATALIARISIAHAQGLFHLFSGWLVFLFAFLCLWLISRIFQRRRTPGQPERSPLEPGTFAGPAPAPVRRTAHAGSYGLASLPLLAGLALLSLRSLEAAVPLRQTFESFPLALGEWRTQDIYLFNARTVESLGTDDVLMRRYDREAGDRVWLYLAYWSSQRRGSTMHSPKNCLPGGGWEPIEASRLDVPMPAPRPPLSVNRYVVEKGGRRQLVFYWYDVRGEAIPGEVAARLTMAKNSLLHQRSDGALVRVSLPIRGDVEATSRSLADFTAVLVPKLDDYLAR